MIAYGKPPRGFDECAAKTNRNDASRCRREAFFRAKRHARFGWNTYARFHACFNPRGVRTVERNSEITPRSREGIAGFRKRIMRSAKPRRRWMIFNQRERVHSAGAQSGRLSVNKSLPLAQKRAQ